MAEATWADVLRDGLTGVIDGARDVLVAKTRAEQYPAGYPQGFPQGYPYGNGAYGPYAGGYQYPQGAGADPFNMGAYPNTGGFFGLSPVLLMGAAVLAVVMMVRD